MSVGAFFATDKENGIVLRGKRKHVGHSARHLTANGVVKTESGRGLDVFFDVTDYFAELLQRFGGLREELDVAVEVEPIHFVGRFYDNRLATRLAYETEHFGMALFPENDDLRLAAGRGYVLYAFLQLQHYGARGIDNFNVVAPGYGISFGRFAVGAKEYLGVVQLAEPVVVNRLQSHFLQALHLFTVVDNVTEAIEAVPFCQFFFCFTDGCCHAEAESRAIVYFYVDVHSFCVDEVGFILRLSCRINLRATGVVLRGSGANCRALRRRLPVLKG